MAAFPKSTLYIRSRSQSFAGGHLQSKDDRWILHKEEWAGDGCMEQIDLTSDDSWSVLIGAQQGCRYVLNAYADLMSAALMVFAKNDLISSRAL